MSGINVALNVAPYGRSFIPTVTDDAGDPLPITAVGSTNDIQIISFNGEPAGAHWVASFAGHNATPFTVATNPPDVSATWTFAVTPGVPCYVRFAPPSYGSFFSRNASLHVFDGSTSGTLLQSGTVDLTGTINYVVDKTDYQALSAGSFIFYSPIAANPSTGLAIPVTPSTATIVVRLTGPNDGTTITMGYVGCSPHGPTALTAVTTTSETGHTYYQDQNEQASYYQPFSAATLAGSWPNNRAVGSGTTDYFTIANAAQSLQAALLALPGNVVPAGAISVTGPDQGPLAVTFAASLGGQAQPSIASSDPSIVVTHDGTLGSRVGGQFPSLSINGVSRQLTDVIPILNRLFYPIPANLTIEPSDSVTFTAPVGFATTANGPLPAFTAVAAINPGAILPAFAATAKTMGIGYNIEPPNYGTPNPVYSNLATGTSLGGPASNFGYPLVMQSGGQEFNVIDNGSATDVGGSGRGTNPSGQGLYSALWDGEHHDILAFLSGTVTAVCVAFSVGNATGNYRIFDIRDPSYYSSNVDFILTVDSSQSLGNGLSTCTLANLKIYPPNPSDPTGNTAWFDPANPTVLPPKYYPSLKIQAGNLSIWRGMDGLNINKNNFVDNSDFTTSQWLGYGSVVRAITTPIASIRSYLGPDLYHPPAGAVIVETTIPHGIVTGQHIKFSQPPSSNPGGQPSVGIAIGPLGSYGFDGYDTVARVVSPTAIVVSGPNIGGMTNVLMPTTGTITLTVQGGGIIYADYPDIANFLDCHILINIPTLATVACATQMGRDAATLNAALEIYLEYSNEVWNFGFVQFRHAVGMGRVLMGIPGTGDYAPYQVYQSVILQDAFIAGFVAAGGNPARIKRCMGTSPGSGGTGAIIPLLKPGAEYAPGIVVDLANGVTTSTVGGVTTTLATFPGIGHIPHFDYFLTSNYIDNDIINNDAQYQDLAGTLDFHQCLDIYDIKIASSLIYDLLHGHTELLASSGLDPIPGLIMYECALSTLIPFVAESATINQVPNQGQRTHAAQYHPRIRDTAKAAFGKWQDSDIVYSILFYMNGPGYYGNTSWAVYTGFSMPPGTGNEPGVSNISDPMNIPTNVSVVGQAVADWQSLLNLPPIINTPPTIAGASLAALRRRRLHS